MTTHASERRKHSSGVFSAHPAASSAHSGLRPHPPSRPSGSLSARESKSAGRDSIDNASSVYAGVSEAERRARAFLPDALVFQSPFTERSATATVREAKQEAQVALQASRDGKPHHLLQPREAGTASPAHGGRRQRGGSGGGHGALGGLVNARPTSAAQAVQAASYFTRDVLDGGAATSSLAPGGDKDRSYLSRMGADSSILARRRPGQAGEDDGAQGGDATRSRSSLSATDSRWSLSRPSSRSVPGPGEVRVGGSLAATMPAGSTLDSSSGGAAGGGKQQYGVSVRGLSGGTTNPFLRCPALFEDVVRSSTAEYSVRPGTGRGETPAHPPLGEYIRSPPGSKRQLTHSSSVTHPAGRHSGRLGGDRTWSRGVAEAAQSEEAEEAAQHTLREDEGEALDDGGGGEAAWWLRNKTPSVAALLRAKVAGAAGGAVGPDGRPLTQNKADLLFRRRLHESVAQLSGAVHSSGKGIIQLLSSYLDANWRPEELGGGGTFMTGGGSTTKVRSKKRYLPYAVYAQATDMHARVAASRERNRDAARSLASPVRATWGVGGTGAGGHVSPEAAAQRKLRNQQMVTSARIASLLGASEGAGGGEDLASWSSLAPVSVDVGQDERLQLNTALPSEGDSSPAGTETLPLDELVNTSSIFNPYHSPMFTCEIPAAVQQRIAEARAAANAGRAADAQPRPAAHLGGSLRGVLLSSPSHGSRPGSNAGRHTPSANRRLTFDLPPERVSNAV